jgi:hypothetical protein
VLDQLNGMAKRKYVPAKLIAIIHVGLGEKDCVKRPVCREGSRTTHFIDRSDRFNQFDHIAPGLYFALDSAG